MFPVVFRGRSAGEGKVPEGTTVEVISLDKKEAVVSFMEGQISLPHDGLNLAAYAAAEMAKGEVVAAPKGEMVVEEVKEPLPPESEAEVAAAAIDELIRANLSKRKLEPPAIIDDAKFLRRAYLVAVGRVPTAEEAENFLGDEDPRKRVKLVQSLVRSPGYASHMANWLFDRLRVVDRRLIAGGVARFPAYRQWVRTAADQNMPWDEMVTTLLTTSGRGTDQESAAVGYFTRDRGMPLDNLAITMRIFLGSRMECAQCHNDPFGDTKQKDFFRLAAFTNGQKPMGMGAFEVLWRQMRQKPLDSLEYRVANMLNDSIFMNSLAGGGTGRIKMPDDYKYKDAKPGEMIGGRFPFGEGNSTTDRKDRDDGRQKFADWVTVGSGERFPGMIANGMWRRVMGAGYFEPSDDYLEPEDTFDPALSRAMAKLMVDKNYNLRDFQEILMLTQAFQAESNPADSEADGGADDFRGRPVHRMSPEQIWDSVVTLVEGNPDSLPLREEDNRILINNRPVLEGQMTVADLSREVTAIEDPESMRAYFNQLLKKIREDSGGGEGNEAMAEMRNSPVKFMRGTEMRASELPSPAPRNHFLALFGQGDRELVDGSNREPNMGQVLSLMNGFVQRKLISNKDAQMNRDLEETEDPEGKIRRLYLSILAREPTPDEIGLLTGEYESAPEAATANIASALLMSAEFLYIQ
jgi:hypothetical protein